MFMNTMAVGPLEPVAFCVTGGTAVAIPRWMVAHLNRLPIDDRAPRELPAKSCREIANGLRKAIVKLLY
jgi:hypothetical protein